MQKELEATLLDIARAHITPIQTLKRRGSDSLDFHEVAIWELKSALETAYRAGQASVANKIGSRS